MTSIESTSLEGRTVDHSAISVSQLVLPEQSGRTGFAHGGEIMKLMDTVAGIVGMRHAHRDLVTARVEGINFYKPVRVGNLVTVEARLTWVGHSSMEVRVEVFAEDIFKEQKMHALTAYFVMVALDGSGKPTQVPPLILTTDKERDLFEKGRRRYRSCKGEILAEDSDFKVCREEPVLLD